jgi:CRISPR/Cas system Type II protein with McrA/HNH and RuvC-like nuclease domain
MASRSVPCFASTAAQRRLRRSAARRSRRRDAQRLVELLLGDAVGDAFGFGIEMSRGEKIHQFLMKF